MPTAKELQFLFSRIKIYPILRKLETFKDYGTKGVECLWSKNDPMMKYSYTNDI